MREREKCPDRDGVGIQEYGVLETETCTACGAPDWPGDAKAKTYRFDNIAAHFDRMNPTVKAINDGENRYRQLVLGQGPLPGYPKVSE